MVSDAVHLGAQITQTIKNEKEEEDDDNVSISTTSTDECQEGAVVLNDTEDRVPYFGNVEVKNSSDVHFGNKTYYQGPVTIKQILYSNRDGEQTETNGMPPQLAIDNKCVIDGVNSDSGYRTDSVHPTSNGHAKTPNGTSNVTTKGEKWPASFNKKGFILTVSVMAVVLVVTIGLIVGLTTRTATNLAHTTTNPLLTDPDAKGDVRIIPRIEWVATIATSSKALQRPIPNIVIFESRTETCDEKRDCIRLVRHLQNSDIEGKGHTDIQYNFLVGGDGNAYYGRGWATESVVAPNCNTHAISIALIGTFSEKPPTRAQIVATKRLIAKGIKLGHISNECRMVAASQLLGGNEGAGKKLLEEISHWPNWVSPDYSKNITLKENFCKGDL